MNSAPKIFQTLRKLAKSHADVEETIACEGTALESSAYRAGKKAFLFVGAGAARLKLGPSQNEAKKTDDVDVGAQGWVKMSLDNLPPLDVVKRWIDESYASMAPAVKKDGAKKVAKKKVARKKR